jgi:hypothetical protein
MGKLINPRAEHLTPQRISNLIQCIPADCWDEPDMAAALEAEGIAHTRYLRSALDLPSVVERARTGDLVVAAAPDGQVIGRVFASKTGGKNVHRLWLWRRFPSGTTEDEVKKSSKEAVQARLSPGIILRVAGEREVTAPIRTGRAVTPSLPTVELLRQQRAALLAQTEQSIAKIDAQIAAAMALEAAEVVRVEAEAAAQRAREHALALARGTVSPG